MKNKYLTALFALIILILFGYWLKCQMDIGLSSSYSLSKYLPFKYFQRNKVIHSPSPGIILDDSFDSFSVFGNWLKLWMREEGKVTKGYDSNGINNSHCLLIKSSSRKSWSCSHNKFVEVQKGDIFSFEVFVKSQGDNISAYAGVAAFDENKKAISWSYIKNKVDKTGEWVKVEKKFTIPDGIDYIRFRLFGAGIGEYRFDDINFRKEG